MKKITLLLASILLAIGINAQSNMTLYNMGNVPQRLTVNPALAPDCKWYLGMPILSSTDISFGSSALNISDINNALDVNSRGKYTVNLKTLGTAFDKGTFVNIGINQEWLNFGFRVKKSMFTFGITEKIKTRVDFPTDLFKVAFEGNGGQNLGHAFNFNFGLDVLHTREFAVGYNRSLLNEKLRVGGRLKYVRGLNVINTKSNDVIFTTDPNTFAYTVTADIEVNTSTPILDSALGVDNPSTLVLGSPKNGGFGIDLGASYELTDRITLSASVVDLGRIFWNDYTTNVKSRNPGAAFMYRGIDINEYTGDSVQGGAGFEALTDTILDVFALDTNKNSFSTGLLGEFYIGGNFHLNDRHNAGILLYGSFYNKSFYPALTLSWNSEFGRILAVSGSYTISRSSATNIGLGLALNLGPEQFYVVGDNLIGTATGNLQTVYIRFGWNHTFGRKKYQEQNKKQKKKSTE
jgi:hypothetical protein